MVETLRRRVAASDLQLDSHPPAGSHGRFDFIEQQPPKTPASIMGIDVDGFDLPEFQRLVVLPYGEGRDTAVAAQDETLCSFGENQISQHGLRVGGWSMEATTFDFADGLEITWLRPFDGHGMGG
jgi:hypothetical protein